MKLISKFNKFISLVVTVSLLLPFFFQPATAKVVKSQQTTNQYKQIFNDFVLPYDYGQITKAHYAGTDRVIINIQDLHCHPKVQKNISNIIETFDKSYGVNKVYLEGAYGQIDTSWITNKIKDTNISNLLDKMLETGRLTGAEYYSVLSGRNEIINGLEEKEPYLENLKRFGNIVANQEKINLILQSIEESTKELKNKYYTKRQNSLDKISKKYKEGKISSQKYYNLLSKHIDKLGIDLSKYENTLAYIMLLDYQKQLDTNKIKKELQNFVLIIKEKIPYESYKMLIDYTDNFSKLDKLFLAAEQLSATYNININNKFKNLDQYFRYIQLSKKINFVELVNEEEKLTQEINTRFSQTKQQRDIVFLINFEKYLKNYLNTKITAQDYKYYTENIDRYRKLWNRYVDNRVLSLLDEYIDQTDKFYQVNIKRNLYFANNMFKEQQNVNKIENKSQAKEDINKIIENIKNVKTLDVVITGGFHSQTITDILENKGISYIVITPNVSGSTQFAQDVYYQLAKEQSEISFSAFAPIIASLSPELQNKIAEIVSTPQIISEIQDKNLSNEERAQFIADLAAAKILESDDVGNIREKLIEILKEIVDEEYKGEITPEFLEQIKIEHLSKIVQSKDRLQELIDALKNSSLKQAEIIIKDVIVYYRNAINNLNDQIEQLIQQKSQLKIQETQKDSKTITINLSETDYRIYLMKKIASGDYVSVNILANKGTMFVCSINGDSFEREDSDFNTKEEVEELLNIKINIENSKVIIDNPDGNSISYIKHNVFENSIPVSKQKPLIKPNQEEIEYLKKETGTTDIEYIYLDKNPEEIKKQIEGAVTKNKLMVLYPLSVSYDITALTDQELFQLYALIYKSFINIVDNFPYGKKYSYYSSTTSFLFEYLKNAFVHGNLSDPSKPIFFYFSKGSLSVYNSIDDNVDISEQEKHRRLSFSAAATLTGFHRGVLMINYIKDYISQKIEKSKEIGSKKYYVITFQEKNDTLQLKSTKETLDKIGDYRIIKIIYKNNAGKNFKFTRLGVAIGDIMELFSFWDVRIENGKFVDKFLQEHENPTMAQKIAVWVIRALSIGLGIGSGVFVAVLFSNPFIAFIGIPAIFVTEFITHYIWNRIVILIGKSNLVLQSSNDDSSLEDEDEDDMLYDLQISIEDKLGVEIPEYFNLKNFLFKNGIKLKSFSGKNDEYIKQITDKLITDFGFIYLSLLEELDVIRQYKRENNEDTIEDEEFEVSHIQHLIKMYKRDRIGRPHMYRVFSFRDWLYENALSVEYEIMTRCRHLFNKLDNVKPEDLKTVLIIFVTKSGTKDFGSWHLSNLDSYVKEWEEENDIVLSKAIYEIIDILQSYTSDEIHYVLEKLFEKKPYLSTYVNQLQFEGTIENVQTADVQVKKVQTSIEYKRENDTEKNTIYIFIERNDNIYSLRYNVEYDTIFLKTINEDRFLSIISYEDNRKENVEKELNIKIVNLGNKLTVESEDNNTKIFLFNQDKITDIVSSLEKNSVIVNPNDDKETTNVLRDNIQPKNSNDKIEVETIYLEDESFANKMIDAIEGNKLLVLYPLSKKYDMEKMSSEEKYALYVQFGQMLYSRFSSYKGEDSLNKLLLTTLSEFIRNAIVHGNFADLSKPVYISTTRRGFKVYNVYNKDYDKKKQKEGSKWGAAGDLSGVHLALQNAEDNGETYSFSVTPENKRIITIGNKQFYAIGITRINPFWHKYGFDDMNDILNQIEECKFLDPKNSEEINQLKYNREKISNKIDNLFNRYNGASSIPFIELLRDLDSYGFSFLSENLQTKVFAYAIDYLDIEDYTSHMGASFTNGNLLDVLYAILQKIEFISDPTFKEALFVNIINMPKSFGFNEDEIKKLFEIVQPSIGVFSEEQQERLNAISDTMLQSVKTKQKLRQRAIEKGYENPDEYRFTKAGIAWGAVYELFSFWDVRIENGKFVDKFLQEHENPTMAQKIAVWVIRALSIGLGVGSGVFVAVLFSNLFTAFIGIPAIFVVVLFSNPFTAFIGIPILFITEFITHYVWNVVNIPNFTELQKYIKPINKEEEKKKTELQIDFINYINKYSADNGILSPDELLDKYVKQNANNSNKSAGYIFGLTDFNGVDVCYGFAELLNLDTYMNGYINFVKAGTKPRSDEEYLELALNDCVKNNKEMFFIIPPHVYSFGENKKWVGVTKEEIEWVNKKMELYEKDPENNINVMRYCHFVVGAYSPFENMSSEILNKYCNLNDISTTLPYLYKTNNMLQTSTGNENIITIDYSKSDRKIIFFKKIKNGDNITVTFEPDINQIYVSAINGDTYTIQTSQYTTIGLIQELLGIEIKFGSSKITVKNLSGENPLSYVKFSSDFYYDIPISKQKELKIPNEEIKKLTEVIKTESALIINLDDAWLFNSAKIKHAIENNELMVLYPFSSACDINSLTDKELIELYQSVVDRFYYLVDYLFPQLSNVRGNSGIRMNYFLVEYLKNAFVHGNFADPSLPIYIQCSQNGEKISVYNSLNEGYVINESEKQRRLSISAAVFLSGMHVGLQTANKTEFSNYVNQNIETITVGKEKYYAVTAEKINKKLLNDLISEIKKYQIKNVSRGNVKRETEIIAELVGKFIDITDKLNINLLGDIKTLMYSAAPGTGKDELSERIFGENTLLHKYIDDKVKLTILHTRDLRDKEVQTAKYIFFKPQVLINYGKNEGNGIIKVVYVNGQPQGFVIGERAYIPVYDVNYKTKKVTDKFLGTKEVEGLASIYSTKKLSKFEGGLAIALEVMRMHPNGQFVFISPFTDEQIFLRGQNNKIILNNFKTSQELILANEYLQEMIVENKGEVNLEQNGNLEKLKAKVQKNINSNIPRNRNIEIIDSDEFIKDMIDWINDNFEMLLTAFKEGKINAYKMGLVFDGEKVVGFINDDYENIVRAMAKEINRRLVSRDGYFEFSKDPSNEKGYERYNRVKEGALQILTRSLYTDVVVNEWVYAGNFNEELSITAYQMAYSYLINIIKFIQNLEKIDDYNDVATDIETKHFVYLLKREIVNVLNISKNSIVNANIKDAYLSAIHNVINKVRNNNITTTFVSSLYKIFLIDSLLKNIFGEETRTFNITDKNLVIADTEQQAEVLNKEFAAEDNVKVISMDIKTEPITSIRGGFLLDSDKGIKVKFNRSSNKLIVYSKAGISIDKDEIKEFIINAYYETRKEDLIENSVVTFVDSSITTKAGVEEKLRNEYTNSIAIPNKVTNFDISQRGKNIKFSAICIQEAIASGTKTFVISEEQADKFVSEIEALRQQGFKFVVLQKYTEINISEGFKDINYDGAKIDLSFIKNTDNIISYIEQIKKKALEKGVGLPISIRFNETIYDYLQSKNINIFEQYGILPIVDSNSKYATLRSIGKIEIENITEENIDNILRNDNVVSIVIDNSIVISDRKSKNKKATTNEQKYKKGLNAALSTKFNYAANAEDLQKLIDSGILSLDLNNRDTENIVRNLDLSWFSNDSKSYIEYQIQKGNYAEVLGFIRGITMNTVASKIGSVIDIDTSSLLNDRKNETVQAILIITIQKMMNGEKIEDMYKMVSSSSESAQSFLNSIKERLNGDLDKVLRASEYGIDKVEPKEIADFTGIPELLSDMYGYKVMAKEVIISVNSLKGMLAAA